MKLKTLMNVTKETDVTITTKSGATIASDYIDKHYYGEFALWDDCKVVEIRNSQYSDMLYIAIE